MRKNNNALKSALVSEQIAEQPETTTAEQPETTTAEQPETTTAEQSIATIGDNNPPKIANYKTNVENSAQAIWNIRKSVIDFKATGEKLGTIFDALSVGIADYAFFLSDDGRKIPSLVTLKDRVKAIAENRVKATFDAETHTYSITTMEQEKKNAENKPGAQGAAKRKANKATVKMVDPTANFLNVAKNTLAVYLEPACKAALLILMGNDSTDGANDGTTYRKGLRWSNHAKDHNKGDVVYKIMERGTKNEYKIPMAIDDAERPEESYIGVIFNDHVLHPNLAIQGSDAVLPKVKAKLYMHRPWLGLTVDGVKLHYARFIGTEKSENGKTIFEKIEIVPETGMAKKIERKTQGTQSETEKKKEETTQGKTDSLTGEPILKIDNASRLQIWQAAIQLARNLPSKDAGLTEKEANMIADLHRLLDENITTRDGNEDGEYMPETDETPENNEAEFEEEASKMLKAVGM